VIQFQISFRFFTRTIFTFLTLLIVYASVVLVAVYAYKFEFVPDLVANITHLRPEDAEAIGLTDATPLLPIALIVVTMLQLKFFHDPWSKLVRAAAGTNGSVQHPAAGSEQLPTIAETSTSLPPPPPTTHSPTQLTPEVVEQTVIREGQNLLHSTAEFLWRMGEVHGLRLILFVLVYVAVKHYCALNFVIILFVTLALCLPAVGQLVTILMVVYMSGIFISRRVYQVSGGC